MQTNRPANGAAVISAELPHSPGPFEARLAATENATRVANAACLYVLSVNETWLELLNESLELPKRFLEAQIDFMEQVFDR